MTQTVTADGVSDLGAVQGGVLGRFRLDGQVALVTGAGRGIGAAIATTLAEAGADIAVVARTAEDVKRVAERVQSLGRRAVALPADVSDLGTLPGMLDQAVAALGSIDIVINNAGGCPS